jgi:hypothetical protein
MAGGDFSYIYFLPLKLPKYSCQWTAKCCFSRRLHLRNSGYGVIISSMGWILSEELGKSLRVKSSQVMKAKLVCTNGKTFPSFFNSCFSPFRLEQGSTFWWFYIFCGISKTLSCSFLHIPVFIIQKNP